ncbi:MAG: SGNH/GDSL hydrolase family protein [Bacteroidetes bacterium]|nr:SGNH/GDSL hydrolase family protein [Fibrella sp.]
MNCAKHQPPHEPGRADRLQQLVRFGIAVSLLMATIGCWYRLPSVEPVTLMPALPVPFTKPAAGTFTYGSTIRFGVDSLPADLQLEYSTDDGRHWQTGDSLLLQTGTTLQLRSRRGAFVSAIRTGTYIVGFKRVLLVGNSITAHVPDTAVGWLGNWGMAASSPATDYVRLLTGRLRTLDSQVVVKTYDAVPFEQRFWTFDYQRVRSLAAFKPDLVVMRIGENVPVNSLTTQNFKREYQRLIDSLTVQYAPVKIVCTTSFFDRPATSDIIRQVAAERKLFLADFRGLVNNRSFQAYDRFKDPGVAMHPGDRGMLVITDLIWDKVH